jgi:hypothetical protein
MSCRSRIENIARSGDGRCLRPGYGCDCPWMHPALETPCDPTVAGGLASQPCASTDRQIWATSVRLDRVASPRMCRAMFFSFRSPVVPDHRVGSHGNGTVVVEEAGEAFATVRRRLGALQLLFVGTEERCSCASQIGLFADEDEDDLREITSRRETVRDVLRTLLDSVTEVDFWVFWWDEWDHACVATAWCRVENFPQGTPCFDDEETPFSHHHRRPRQWPRSTEQPSRRGNRQSALPLSSASHGLSQHAPFSVHARPDSSARRLHDVPARRRTTESRRAAMGAGTPTQPTVRRAHRLPVVAVADLVSNCHKSGQGCLHLRSRHR